MGRLLCCSSSSDCAISRAILSSEAADIYQFALAWARHEILVASQHRIYSMLEAEIVAARWDTHWKCTIEITALWVERAG